MLAAARFGVRKIASLTSGSRRTAWIARNTPSRTIAAASPIRVLAEPQPTSGARTIAYTAAPRPSVTVNAPSRSREPVRAPPAGISAGVAISATKAIGMLM